MVEDKVKFEFKVTVEAERVEGKFASREDLAGQIRDELENTNPGSLTGENDGEYDIVEWEVEEVGEK
jgi:hypothetical protein